MKENFRYWLSNIAKKSNGDDYKEKTVRHYISGIDAIKKDFNVDFWILDNSEEILEKKFKLECNSEFIKKDKIGNRMYSCALDRLIDYSYYESNISIEEDIKKIELDNDLDLEEKDSFIESLINIRNPQFQRNFKKELIREFNNKCALCIINDKRLLIASHIIRYSDCNNKADMYKSYNGLLLCVTHDALFDKHLISFDKDGKILINKSINIELYDLLQINNNLKLDNKYLNDKRQTCLESHKNDYYKKES